MINPTQYHLYATLFDAFASVIGTGNHCDDISLFEADAGPSLREWAAARGLVVESEELSVEGSRSWTRLAVKIGNSSIVVHMDVDVDLRAAAGEYLGGMGEQIAESEPEAIEPEIAF